MSKFNDSYERLHYKWEYGADGRVGLDGWWNDYNVEKQLEDWITINEEYTKLSNALDKACEELHRKDCLISQNCTESLKKLHGMEQRTMEGMAIE